MWPWPCHRTLKCRFLDHAIQNAAAQTTVMIKAMSAADEVAEAAAAADAAGPAAAAAGGGGGGEEESVAVERAEERAVVAVDLKIVKVANYMAEILEEYIILTVIRKAVRLLISMVIVARNPMEMNHV